MNKTAFIFSSSLSVLIYLRNFPILTGRMYKLLSPWLFISLLQSMHFFLLLNCFHNNHLQ